MMYLADARKNDGFILALVAGIILCLTLLCSSLLLIPGGLRGCVKMAVRDVQKIYDAESSILLHSRQVLSSGENLPSVEEQAVGPFLEFCADPVCGYAVKKYADCSYGEFHSRIEKYRSGLRTRILELPGVKHLSGNRRLFGLPSSTAMVIENGDLLVDVESGDSLSSASFVVDGNVTLGGKAVYDTLRIFAQGNVTLKGFVRVNVLEVAAGDVLSIAGHVRFRGFGTAWRQVSLSDNVQGNFPSMLMAIGSNGPEANAVGHSRVAGLLLAPSGTVNGMTEADWRDSDNRGKDEDSLRLALPGFFDGENMLFDSRYVK